MPRSQSFLEKIKTFKIDWLIVGPVAAYLITLNIVLFWWADIFSIQLLLLTAVLFLTLPLMIDIYHEERIDWLKVGTWLLTNGPFILINVIVGAAIVSMLVLFLLGGIE